MALVERNDLGFTCKDCPNRYPGCHGKCEKYQREKEAWTALNKKANAGKDADYYVMLQVLANRDRTEKKRRGRKGYHKFGS